MTTDAGTPRTDAAELVESETRWGVAPKRWPYVPADFARTLERSLTAAEAERDALRARVAGLEAGLRKAEQAMCIAYDWNLHEIEIDGEMVRTADLQSEFRAILAPSSEETK